MSFRKDLSSFGKGKSAILEIGPLDKAVFSKQNAPVFYADHLGQEQLKEKYAADPDVKVENIPFIDFDLSKVTWQEISYQQKFDLIFASHVIEHTPDPISWLKELSLCLNEEGEIVLIVPDKRFTFDFFQTTTSLSELLKIHEQRPSRPSPETVKRYFDHVTLMRPRWAWIAPWLFRLWAPKTFASHSLDISKLAENQYIDVHCHFWTPQSFKLTFEFCQNTHIPMALTKVIKTERHDIEFLAIFKKKIIFQNQLQTIEVIDSQIKETNKAPSWGILKSLVKVLRGRLRL